MMRTFSTTGAATVAFHSLSSSPTARWNSSSRGPCGMSSSASTLPAATAWRKVWLSSRNRLTCVTISRRAVGTACRVPPISW